MGRDGRRILGPVLVMLAALSPAAPGIAGFDLIPPAAAEEAQRISADRAAEIARSATGGRVLSVERRRNGRPWYRVKVLIDGERVRYVAVDGMTGRVRQ